MAVIAFLAVTAGMNVIQRMTGMALPWNILVFLIGMTAITGQFRMLVPQYKVRFVMIEFLTFPAALIMTISALFTQSACMNVITLMTCEAIMRCIAVFFLSNMAGCTVSHTMCTL